MPSSNAKTAARRDGTRKCTLQRLRREAGYATAKDFAAEVGVPASTYSRYERAPEGPDCGIPLPSAWAMADALGCSIDVLVGRVGIDERPETTWDERLGALNVMDREIVTSFIEFIEDRADAQARAAASRRGRM